MTKDTTALKLSTLQHEWHEGRSTESDLDYWKVLMEDFSTKIVPQYPEYKELEKEYEEIIQMLSYLICLRHLKRESITAVILAGFEGDYDALERKLQQLPGESNKDTIVTLGGFLKGDSQLKFEESLGKALEKAFEEDMILLLSNHERKRFLEFDMTDNQRTFLRELPAFLDTEDFVLLTDPKADGALDYSLVLEGLMPNMSDKMIVVRIDEPMESGYRLNQKNRMMALGKGAGTRLGFKDQKLNM